MTLYSVYECRNEMPEAVADRFSCFAALLPPLYALVYGLWLMLIGWVVAVAALVGLGFWLGGEAAFWLYVVLALLIGFEAPTLHRLRLGRHGWQHSADVIAADPDLALVEFLKSEYLKQQPQ